jgi:hypothetical protein
VGGAREVVDEVMGRLGGFVSSKDVMRAVKPVSRARVEGQDRTGEVMAEPDVSGPNANLISSTPHQLTTSHLHQSQTRRDAHIPLHYQTIALPPQPTVPDPNSYLFSKTDSCLVQYTE